MAMTLRLPEADDKLLTERAAQEQRSKHDLVVEAVHKMLSERRDTIRRIARDGITANRELLDRLAQ